MTLETDLTYIKGVGPEVVKKLHSLQLKTVGDLIRYYPRRYEDYSKIAAINKLKPGVVTIRAVIKQSKGRYVRRGMHITEAVASDATGSVRLVWFNQPYRAAQLKPDQEYFISGEYQLSHARFSIMNPSAELVSSFPVNTARIIPVYRETKGFKSSQLRKFIREVMPAIDALPETLPGWLVDEMALMPRSESIKAVHFPESVEHLDEAIKRLGFEEVFELTLAALLNKYELHTERSVEIRFQEQLAKQFVANLPFTLTDDQRKVVWQIYKDIQKNQPMNRLVEGDVGSGKTVVAVMAALMAIKQGFQVALMAPTEILARQHAESIQKLLTPLGMSQVVGLLVGSLKPAQKKTAHEAVDSGKMQLIVGTHALIAEKVNIQKLGLVIVDEQHRFGVEERKKLLAKAGHAVHVLNMTATPIPRSLALTLYGDMDVSLLTQKPANRLPIVTTLVPPSDRPKVLAVVKEQVKQGRQVYVICPLISKSDVLTAKSAEDIHALLSQKELKGFRIGLLHGKLSTQEKEDIMQLFSDRKLDVLVSTTVLEVGVDVPNATVIMIESPERFGLAQIHQLRGRVGRGADQSYCYLMLDGASAPSRRLKALEQSSDGFRLAELDLELRGPGAIYGTMQHGSLDLTFTKLTDVKAIARARKAAQEFIDKGENITMYKELYKRVSKLRSVTNLN